MSVTLAFDTATRATVVGVLRPGAEPIERRDDPPAGERPRHAQVLLALCEDALDAAGAAWADVGRIGAGVGPGSFTGLRIGVATARALAQARPVEVVAVSTLEALAHAARGADPSGRTVLAVLDARRGEAFAAAFGPAAAPAPRAAAVAPQDLGALGAPGWLAVGDGAVRYRSELQAAEIEVPGDEDVRHRVAGVALVELAASGTPEPVASLVPDYVRLPDAQVQHRGVAAGP